MNTLYIHPKLIGARVSYNHSRYTVVPEKECTGTIVAIIQLQDDTIYAHVVDDHSGRIDWIAINQLRMLTSFNSSLTDKEQDTIDRLDD